MCNRNPTLDTYEFNHENTDSVHHLESLILLWNSRPVGWTEEELSARLYIPRDLVGAVQRDLMHLQIVQKISGKPPRYSYLLRSEEQSDLMDRIDHAYRRDLVRISTMIHSKASSPVREFARAFRFKGIRKSERCFLHPYLCHNTLVRHPAAVRLVARALEAAALVRPVFCNAHRLQCAHIRRPDRLSQD
jgi:hypothetical protein